ncbi:hypothetical protein [Streptomyces sp. NPDC055140]
MILYGPPPPWAETRPDLADDPIAMTIHAIAVELALSGFPTLRELPEYAGDLPPQVIAQACPEEYLLNIGIHAWIDDRIEWHVYLGPRSWFIELEGWTGREVELPAHAQTDAVEIVRRALEAVGLAPADAQGRG